MDRPGPPSAKAVTALLREARSLSRRVDKLSGTATAVGDLTTKQLAAEACTSRAVGAPPHERRKYAGSSVNASSTERAFAACSTSLGTQAGKASACTRCAPDAV